MNKKSDIELKKLKEVAYYANLFKQAAREEREENKRMGFDNVFCRDGIIYYEKPNGDIIKKNDQ